MELVSSPYKILNEGVSVRTRFVQDALTRLDGNVDLGHIDSEGSLDDVGHLFLLRLAASNAINAYSNGEVLFGDYRRTGWAVYEATLADENTDPHDWTHLDNAYTLLEGENYYATSILPTTEINNGMAPDIMPVLTEE